MTRAVPVTFAVLLAVACGDNASSPTSPTTTTAVTELLIGSLSVGGSRFYSFTLSSAGTVSVMLASVTSPITGSPVAKALEIGVGVPAGTGCATTTAQSAAAALTSQMIVSLQAGTFCVRVADTGELTSAVNFALRFTHP